MKKLLYKIYLYLSKILYPMDSSVANFLKIYFERIILKTITQAYLDKNTPLTVNYDEKLVQVDFLINLTNKQSFILTLDLNLKYDIKFYIKDIKVNDFMLLSSVLHELKTSINANLNMIYQNIKIWEE